MQAFLLWREDRQMSLPSPKGYADLAALARLNGVPLREVIVLSDENDPFFCDRPGKRQDSAEWFASLWDRLAVPNGVHLRRLHYLLVSTPGCTTLDGAPYENTNACWRGLLLAAGNARYLDLVPASAFVDMRASAPAIYEPEETRPASLSLTHEYPDTFDCEPLDHEFDCEFPPLPSLTITPPSIAEPFAIELWAEKSTMNDILVPLAERHNATLITGVGDLSITHCALLVERAKEHGRKVRVLYISDFDPAGQGMPVAVARKLEFFIRRDCPDLDMRLRPVILTAAQVAEYHLPRVPIKDSDARRSSFEAMHGEGAVELDALEALRPGEFRQILEREIARYRDPTFDLRMWQKMQQIEEQISAAREQAIAAHAEEIEAAEQSWDDAQVEIEVHRQAIADHEEAIRARLAEWQAEAEPVWEAIAGDIESQAPDAEEIDWPEREPAPEDDDALFDSKRDYVDQIYAFKLYQGK
jgi:hypothetical protein